MNIIDAHTHIGDIYTGTQIQYPLDKIPFGLVSILELLKFNRPYPRSKKNSSRLLGDIAYMESCKRVQLCKPETYIEIFKKNGVNKAILLPIEPNVKTEYVIELSKKYQEFIPFASVDFSQTDYLARLKFNIENGCKGIKIHPVIQKIHPEDERIANILEEFSKYNLPVCFHTGPARAGFIKIDAEKFAYPENFINLLKKFPKMKFIFVHMGLEYYNIVIEMALKFKNIYLDTSFQPPKTILKALQNLGCERLIFGSDFPLVKQETTLNILKTSIKDN
ncbi:MAG: amidohydrolase family protein, partial [Candidatus Hydrogenedentota bacterium]